MNKYEIDNLPKDLFVPAVSQQDAEGLTSKPLSFWQDAGYRLLHNKYALSALCVIVAMLLLSIVVPKISKWDVSKKVGEKTELIAQLPPRVPLLEKIGFLDGSLIKEYAKETITTLGYDTNDFVIVKEFRRDNLDYVRVKEYTYRINGIEDRYHYFGTDVIGRDIWTRVWFGTSISLLIGFYAAIIDVLIGVVYGGIAGFYGGTRIDDLMMRFLEIIYGIPSIVILFILFMFLKPGIIPIAIAIALTSWVGVARMVRAQFLRLRDQEFVLAARTLGASPKRLITKHLIPNVVAQIIVMASFSIPAAIFYEAFLAFIGIGLNPRTPSLGVLINESLATTYGAMTYVYQLVLPCLILSLLMLSINLLANGLRDALDPRMRGN